MLFETEAFTSGAYFNNIISVSDSELCIKKIKIIEQFLSKTKPLQFQYFTDTIVNYFVFIIILVFFFSNIVIRHG